MHQSPSFICGSHSRSESRCDQQPSALQFESNRPKNDFITFKENTSYTSAVINLLEKNFNKQAAIIILRHRSDRAE